jgi:diaminopimelate epimerase
MTAPSQTAGLRFVKMHGLGNDCVIIDGRTQTVVLDTQLIQRMGDRHRGIGFDQLVLLSKSNAEDVTACLRFFNADGSEAGACGNATRCVAALLFKGAVDDGNGRAASQSDDEMQLTLLTARGRLLVWRDKTSGGVAVDMGEPQLDWQNIPLARDVGDTTYLRSVDESNPPSASGMGNPHCVFFVDDADAVDVAKLGAEIEKHELFPRGCNVEFATVVLPMRRNAGKGDRARHIRMRVFERGVGITQACGSGACAVAVSAVRRGLAERDTPIEVVLDGGSLFIEWRSDDNHVIMSGPATFVFTGIFEERAGG